MKIKKESRNKEVMWMNEVASKDYEAAISYLSLLTEISEAQKIVESLKGAKIVKFKAKDIFRASSLPLLGLSHKQVEKNLKKIRNGKKLSPILLVRDKGNGKVVVADGYHRICAIYSLNDDVLIPCKIV